jgi:hypothetical protein
MPLARSNPENLPKNKLAIHTGRETDQEVNAMIDTKAVHFRMRLV